MVRFAEGVEDDELYRLLSVALNGRGAFRRFKDVLYDFPEERLIHDARARAGLTQREPAELIGTSQPTIARLGDADYTGHSLGMLRRIAAALHLRLELRLVPDHEAV